MGSKEPGGVSWRAIAAVARALGTAVVSLALGVGLCLCLLLGGIALASGVTTAEPERGGDRPEVATSPAGHSRERQGCAADVQP